MSCSRRNASTASTFGLLSLPITNTLDINYYSNLCPTKLHRTSVISLYPLWQNTCHNYAILHWIIIQISLTRGNTTFYKTICRLIYRWQYADVWCECIETSLLPTSHNRIVQRHSQKWWKLFILNFILTIHSKLFLNYQKLLVPVKKVDKINERVLRKIFAPSLLTYS